MGDTFSFFSVKELLELGRRTITLFEETQTEWHEDDPRKARANGAAQLMLVACAESIAALGEPALWPLALEIIDLLDGYDDHMYRWAGAGTGSLSGFARAGVLLKELEELADDPRERVRRAIAESFPVDTPEHIAVVSRLAADEDAYVADAARRRLEGVEIPFWTGIFSFDPFSALPPAQAHAAKKPIDKLCALFSERRWSTPQQKNAFFRAARALPPRLEIDVLTRAVLGDRVGYSGDKHPIETRLAQLGDAGVEAALQILNSPRLSDSAKSLFIGAFARALPPAVARRVLPGWLTQVRAAPRRQLSRDTLEYHFAEAIGAGWPEGDDPTPVLEAILERAEGEDLAYRLSAAISRSTRHDVLLPRLEPALRAGFPDEWSSLEWTCRQQLEALPKKALRALAERTLDCGHEKSVAWACGLLLKQVFDGKRDGTRATRAAQLDADPRTRRAMRLHHTIEVLPLVRADLAGGAVDFAIAAATMKAIGALYGGTFANADHTLLFASRMDRDEQIKLPDGTGTTELENADIKPFLGPVKQRLPPTPDEWRVWRALRDAHTFTECAEDGVALYGIEFGTSWEPSDHAYFDRALERLRGAIEPVDFYAATAATIIAIKGGKQDLPLLEELTKLAARREDTGLAARQVKHVARWFRERLGLAPADQKTSPAEQEADAWLDEQE